MRFSTTSELKEAAEKFAVNLYERHINYGYDLNPYCTPGARTEFNNGLIDSPRYSWDIPTDWDYRYQTARAVFRLIEKNKG